MVLLRCLQGFGMVWAWAVYGFGMVLYGRDMVLAWFGHGFLQRFGMVLVWC